MSPGRRRVPRRTILARRATGLLVLVVVLGGIALLLFGTGGSAPPQPLSAARKLSHLPPPALDRDAGPLNIYSADRVGNFSPPSPVRGRSSTSPTA